MRRFSIVVPVVLAVALLGGCASTPPDAAGFLADDWQLKPDKYGKHGLLWAEKPGFDWKQYQRVQLDPVLVYYHPRAATKAIQPDDLKRLADYFREAVVAELGESYPMTNDSAPDMLCIRAAITDVVPANPALNAATTVLALVPMDLGGASIEAEFIDSVSGSRLAAMAERKRGSPTDLKGGFTELGHARTAFREWAGELKQALKAQP